MNLSQLKIKDDQKSVDRLEELISKDRDWRHYVNQLEKCNPFKRSERVQTWYPILKEKKPEYAEKLKKEYFDFLSEDQKNNINEEAENKRQEEKRQKDYKKAYGEAFQFMCNYLYNENLLKEIASRNATWNSYSGFIGSNSHKWTRSSGSSIKDIDQFVRNLYDKPLLARTRWSSGYSRDFGMSYSSGSVWSKEIKNLRGSYDDDSNMELFLVRRISKSTTKKLFSEVKNEFDILSDQDIEEIFNSLYN